MSANTRREIELWKAKKDRPAYFRRLETKKQKRTLLIREGSFYGGTKAEAIHWNELNVRVCRFHGAGTLEFHIERLPVIKEVETKTPCACGGEVKTIKKEKIRERTSERIMLYPHEARLLLDFLLETFE